MAADKIKATIRAMLNLARDQGAAEGEARNAMAFASRLMDEHNLSEDDLADFDPETIRIDREKMRQRFASLGFAKCCHWESLLVAFVEDFVGCVVAYRATDNGAGLACFCGLPEDATLAAELFGDLRQGIESEARQRYRGVSRGPGRDYCEGYVHGLFGWLDDARECDAKNPSDAARPSGGTSLALLRGRSALVATKRNAAYEWLADRGIRLRSSARRPSRDQFDAAAYESGYTTGHDRQPNCERRAKLPGAVAG